MGRYRKKPVEIDAVQFTRDNGFDFIGPNTTLVCVGYDGWYLEIDTLEGTMTAAEGDWIITGVNGERYPCKPDIFDATYEPVEDQ